MIDILKVLRDKTASHPRSGEQVNHVVRRLNIHRAQAADEIERLKWQRDEAVSLLAEADKVTIWESNPALDRCFQERLEVAVSKSRQEPDRE